jgi:hypothetical protein
MMKTARSMIILVLSLGFILQACARPPRGGEETTAASFSQGVFQTTYRNTLFRAFEAARSTLEEQGMAITSATRNTDAGTINAVMEDGTVVNIALQSRQPDLTDASIRVGAYGSEEVSRELSREIKSRLEKNR